MNKILNILKQVLIWFAFLFTVGFTILAVMKYDVVSIGIGAICGLALWNWYDVFVNKRFKK